MAGLIHKAAEQLGLHLPAIDLEALSREDLQQLDMWVDQYNHQTDPQRGISSSQLLVLMLLEQLTEDLTSETLDLLPSSAQQRLNQILQQHPLQEVVISNFIHQSPQLDHLEDLLPHTPKLMEQIKPLLTDMPLARLQPGDSVEEQLQRLSPIIGSRYQQSLLRVIDLFREQNKFRGGGPGEPELPVYEEFFPEGYTTDQDWMPQVVLMAKHCKVWLHQLSRKYQQEISQLDQIPIQELQQLVERGITALWLIGLWQRSPGSAEIKRQMGQEPNASAYALWDNTIASDLGGLAAYKILDQMATSIGLRLASDMVPNHTGIMSRWIIEYPHRFVQTADPPFPSYSFTHDSLSHQSGIDIYLEDGYYSRSDAAVVFKRVDQQSGQVSYIYHGNDGTSIPWNDTAQLDFLQSEVRQAVIDEILKVARLFPIIRLDAAMVLVKQHFQRLWYPVPGSGGDIPSRSRFGLSAEEFNRKFPIEFWREVVDRVATEVPDTLLVAEAFWMLEGYFVRSLGVHRVYNSAFMHMLRDQKNREYRQLIADTLRYDPRILQRYVNFMSNPDEDTAAAQFDKGDKYFGVLMLMVTLPGMPMLAHGQIEGFIEKYGMEFQRDQLEEQVDQQLVQLHQQLIFPLLKFRYIFARVAYFRFYTVIQDQPVDDIYAFSNRDQDQLFLVVYNNQIEQRQGWINLSEPFNAEVMELGTDQEQTTLLKEINWQDASFDYCSFRNFHSDHYYLRSAAELEQGLYIQLRGYQFQVFTDFRLYSRNPHLDQLYQAGECNELQLDQLTPDQ